MNMITLVCCMLALSSSVFGRPGYGGYQSAPITQISSVNTMRDLPSQQSNGYGQQTTENVVSQPIVQQEQPITSNGYGSSYSSPSSSRLLEQSVISSPVSYGSQYQQINIPQQRTIATPRELLLDQQQQLQNKIQSTQVWTEADTLCRGQQPETIIPLSDYTRFVVCLADGKGFEQTCPQNLVFHTKTRRCERKLGELENPCSSQPCLNGGKCIQTDVSSFQCQCLSGFDGTTCELDARICQTQQPCGSSPDSRCQSFRFGAALQYICILQNGRSYGLSSQQAQPSPCTGLSGPQPLAMSDKGFVMCDGQSMYVESCPGGTIWDDSNKACIWPDMTGVVTVPISNDQSGGYGQSYGQQRSMAVQQRQFEQPKPVSSYGSSFVQPQQLDQPRTVSSYGSSFVQPQQQLDQSRTVSSYGSSFVQPQQQLEQPKSVSSYGSSFIQPQQQLEQPKTISSYGSSLPQRSLEQPRLTSSYGTQQRQFEQPKSVSSYGSSFVQPQQQLEQPKTISSYGSQHFGQQQLEQPKFSQYGSQTLVPQQDQTQQVSGY